MQKQSIAQPHEPLKAGGQMPGRLPQDFLVQTYNFGGATRVAMARTVARWGQERNFGTMPTEDGHAYDAYKNGPAMLFDKGAMSGRHHQQVERAMAMRNARQHSPAEDLALQLCRRWKLSDADASAMLGIGDGDARVCIDRSELRLRGRDQEDRVRHLLRIFEVLSQLLGDNPVYEREWLDTEMPILQGKSPMDIMRRGGFMDIASMADLANEAAGRY